MGIGMEIKYRPGFSGAGNIYYVDVREADMVRSVYVGFVMKSSVDNKWRNSYNDDTVTFRTRKAATAAMEPLIRVELAAVTHYANAVSEDRERSWSNSPIYIHSKAMLMDAVRAAFPDMNADDVYYRWVADGETIRHAVEGLRRDAADWAAHEADVAAQEAQEAREAATSEVSETPQERDITIDISGDGLAGYTVTMVAVYPEAKVADGFTRSGTPFNITQVHYAVLADARRMVDVMVAEFRSNPDKIWAAYTVTLTGLASLSSRLSGREAIDDMAQRLAQRVVRIREGGSFRGAVVASAPAMVASVPSYRVAGFPSLDAAIGAWHGGNA